VLTYFLYIENLKKLQLFEKMRSFCVTVYKQSVCQFFSQSVPSNVQYLSVDELLNTII